MPDQMEAKMSGLETPCVECGMSCGDNTNTVLFPKCWAHKECYDRDPAGTVQRSEEFPCCASRLVVEALGGNLIAKRKDIPQNEVWWWDGRTLKRYSVETWQEVGTPPPANPGVVQTEPLPDLPMEAGIPQETHGTLRHSSE